MEHFYVSCKDAIAAFHDNRSSMVTLMVTLSSLTHSWKLCVHYIKDLLNKENTICIMLQVFILALNQKKKKKTHTEKIINCECSNRVYYEKHHVSYESNRASNKSITVAGFQARFCEK